MIDAGVIYQVHFDGIERGVQERLIGLGNLGDLS